MAALYGRAASRAMAALRGAGAACPLASVRIAPREASEAGEKKPMSEPLAKFIDLPVVSDPRGNLCFAESNAHVPFSIERVYYLYDVPAGSVRAGHAHKILNQLLVAVAGSFDVRLNDGTREEVVTLNRPHRGLHIGPMMWRELENFSSGAVCVVMASTPYDESDYYRDMDAFLASVRR